MLCHRDLHQPNNLGRNDCCVGRCGCGGMVDAADSKSASGDRVGVQVPSAVPPNLFVFGRNAMLALGHICRPPSKTGDVI